MPNEKKKPRYYEIPMMRRQANIALPKMKKLAMLRYEFFRP